MLFVSALPDSSIIVNLCLPVIFGRVIVTSTKEVSTATTSSAIVIVSLAETVL